MTLTPICDPHSIRRQSLYWQSQGLTVAFVPTMGNLHAGHLALVQAAKQCADKVCVSIFVNPMQFSPEEDFDEYPRTLEEDLKVLASLGGVDAVFTPTAAMLYPEGAEKTTAVNVAHLGSTLCGVRRPHFFQGVATIVMKLCQIVCPQRLVLGEKDYQQLQVIKAMVRDLWLPIEVLSVPIIREPSGLAMSSRNRYLNESQQQQACALYACLQATAKQLQSGERNFQVMESNARKELQSKGLQPDYYSVRCPESLKPAQPGGKEYVVLAAAVLGKTRLIDNLQVSLTD